MAHFPICNCVSRYDDRSKQVVAQSVTSAPLALASAWVTQTAGITVGAASLRFPNNCYPQLSKPTERFHILWHKGKCALPGKRQAWIQFLVSPLQTGNSFFILNKRALRRWGNVPGLKGTTRKKAGPVPGAHPLCTCSGNRDFCFIPQRVFGSQPSTNDSHRYKQMKRLMPDIRGVSWKYCAISTESDWDWATEGKKARDPGKPALKGTKKKQMLII